MSSNSATRVGLARGPPRETKKILGLRVFRVEDVGFEAFRV